MTIAASVSFAKVEGLGNDFVLIDGRALPESGREDLVGKLPTLAPRLCHRRLGVGADGILILGPPRTAGAAGSMLVVNHDGSRPEMCGNGLRCAALVMALPTGGDLLIDTDNGPLACHVTFTDSGRRSAAVRVEMGLARDGGTVEPAAGYGRVFRRVTVGNPHAVAFVDPGTDPETLARTLGPALEIDPLFMPARTNVEFAEVVSDQQIITWVWERGCGITLACGTGACAVAFAATLDRRVDPDRPITVSLPGGALTIVVPGRPDLPLTMTGPARRVFDGRFDPTHWL